MAHYEFAYELFYSLPKERLRGNSLPKALFKIAVVTRNVL